MKAQERRQALLKFISESRAPVTGSELARTFNVSRQVIVSDIAILRAEGAGIIATPQGYTVISPAMGPLQRRLVACRHDRADTEDELMIMVNNGAQVLDVIVEHPIYGQLTGNLFLRTPEDVRRFVRLMEDTGASLLSSLTGGVHLHTLAVPDESVFARVRDALAERGYLLSPEKAAT